MLAAGTVFNQVVLWAVGCVEQENCHMEDDSISQSTNGNKADDLREVIHRLTGHQVRLILFFFKMHHIP